ncbi:unnamed protein product, partial [Darwinula stevensoni]
MAITLSPAAAKHVSKYLAKRGKGVGVRLGVKTTGCSGLAYKLEYVDEQDPSDVVFDIASESGDVKLLIDPKSLPYLDGTQLDYVREGLNEGFKFHNPNERDRCGCGESFRFAQDADTLTAKWKALQMQAHPDKFAADGAAAQRLAMQWSVRINEAYQRLKNPISRAAYLCQLNDHPIEGSSNTAMPPDFLMQQMQWREALDEADDDAALDTLSKEVHT